MQQKKRLKRCETEAKLQAINKLELHKTDLFRLLRKSNLLALKIISSRHSRIPPSKKESLRILISCIYDAKLAGMTLMFFFCLDSLFELTSVVHSTSKGNVVEGFTKNSTVFDLKDAVGIIAMVANIDANLKSMLSVLVVALLHGNAVVLCNQPESNTISEMMK